MLLKERRQIEISGKCRAFKRIHTKKWENEKVDLIESRGPSYTFICICICPRQTYLFPHVRVNDFSGRRHAARSLARTTNNSSESHGGHIIPFPESSVLMESILGSPRRERCLSCQFNKSLLPFSSAPRDTGTRVPPKYPFANAYEHELSIPRTNEWVCRGRR